MPSHTTHNTPALRFPGYTGVWEQPQLRFTKQNGEDYSKWTAHTVADVFAFNTTKNKNCDNNNVITNSALYGLIPQQDYFDRNIAVEGNTSHYTVIQKNDFVYNQRQTQKLTELKQGLLQNMFPREGESVPRLRFPGFTTTWKQHKLGSLGHATGGTPIESEFSKDGVYKVISIGSYSTDNTYHDQGIRAIKSEKTKSRLLNKNDLTMILNDKTTIEKNIIGRTLLIEESGVYVYNQRTERIELDITRFDPSFIYEELNAPHIRQKIIAQSQGNTQVYVNWSSISQLVYSIPSLSEQQKIGSFFRKLDDLLALHQRQTQKLIELKQGLLQNMFPREGESVPRLRFPGFTTTWKQQQFNDVYTSFPNKMYQVQTSEYHEEGKFIVIDQGTNDIAGYTNREDKVCHQFPCIIFGDHTTNIKYVNEPFVVGADGVKTLKATGDCAFASYNLKVNNVTQQGYKRHFSQLKEINVLCPSLSEQQKIGSFFRKLDDLLALHEQYTVKLTHLKKGLLQKMFPQD